MRSRGKAGRCKAIPGRSGLLLFSVLLLGAGQPAQAAGANDAQATTAAARPADYRQILQQLYIAYFGRPADPAGMAYFSTHLAANAAPTQIGDYYAAYSRNGTVKALMDGFADSAESRLLYPGDTSVFVTAIYRNVLNREPDSDGLAYWVGVVDAGALSRGNAALSLMASALAGGKEDAALVRKKLVAANAFTSSLNTESRASAYDGETANVRVRAWLAGVSVQSDTVALHVQSQDMLARLMGAQGRRVIYGTIATGQAAQGADVTLFDQEGLLGDTFSDLYGNFLIEVAKARNLVWPIVSKARFTVFGKEIELFSLENDVVEPGIRINGTPVTDLIARSYAAVKGKLNPLEDLPEDGEVLGTIKANVRKVLGPLLPDAAPDPVSDMLVPNPHVSEWDALMERVRIDILAEAALVKDSNDRPMASLPVKSLGDPAFVATDANSVSAAEAVAAVTARGGFPAVVTAHANEAATGMLPAPADFRAVQTGELGFKLSWRRVENASHYLIFEQVDSPPTITAGTYSSAAVVPNYATGGNAEHDVELSYSVPGTGTYHWVIAAVVDDGRFSEYTLGTVSEPVSLNFDPGKNVTCTTEPLASGAGLRNYCYYYTGSGITRRKLWHGSYLVTDKDGRVLVEGKYTDDKESDVWRYYYANDKEYWLHTEIRYGEPGKMLTEFDFHGDHGHESSKEYTYVYKPGVKDPDVYAKHTCGNHASHHKDRYGTVYWSYLQGPLLSRLDEYWLRCPSGFVGGTNSGLSCCRSAP
jgi:hypothetical protein